MAENQHEGGISYRTPGLDYFEDRELRRHAGVFYLWALGVAAVISGDFSGWNLGFAVGGWGGMFLGAIIITVMYLGLTYSIAEMSPALPHTGGAYSFARTAFGPWGGFITGVAENVEYVLTPAVIVYLHRHLSHRYFPDAGRAAAALVDARLRRFSCGSMRAASSCPSSSPLIVTLLAITVLVIFFAGALPFFDFSRYALNIGADPVTGAAVELPEGNGPFLPFGIYGILAAMPFAVWLFLAIEQLPLAAEESVDPKRDMPRGIMLRHVHADRARLPRADPQPFHPDRARDRDRRERRGHNRDGAFALGTSGEPILDGFRAIFDIERGRRFVACSHHRPCGELPRHHLRQRQANLFAVAGGLFPAFPLDHAWQAQDPEFALIAGAAVGLAVMLVVWFAMGGERAVPLSAACCSTWRCSARCSPICCRRSPSSSSAGNSRNIERPYRSPLGIPGAALTVIIAADHHRLSSSPTRSTAPA